MAAVWMQRVSPLFLVHVAASYSANSLTTVVGTPEVVGGPGCCMFDSPFLGLQRADNVTVGFTSNSDTYLYSEGVSVDNFLQPPIKIGLGPDPSNTSYSHCGKWLNAAWASPDGVIHAYFHQEWHCDYARGDYTNKSVGYASSSDGGQTWDISADQLIAGSNFSTSHQCGEGDHGVVQWGDYLYLYFLEWDAPDYLHGGTSVGLARSRISDAGAPGTWWKYSGGEWTSPGVGGPADAINNVPGTAVYAVPDVGQMVTIGVIFSAPLDIAWSSDGLQWDTSSAGPLFNAGWSSWDRNANSSELFGYPGLTGPQGSNKGLPTAGGWVYFTYLAPGTDFTQRWMVRRRVDFLTGSSGPSGGAPTALAGLSVWTSNSTPANTWVTGGPVVPVSGYNVSVPLLAYLATWQPPAPAPELVEVVECLLPPGAGVLPQTVALTKSTECGTGSGSGVFGAGKALRTPGWAAQSQADAEALGWASVQRPGPPGGSVTSTPGQLWRCISTSGGVTRYSASFGGASSCASSAGGGGFVADVMLGYALSPLQPTTA